MELVKITALNSLRSLNVLITWPIKRVSSGFETVGE